VRETEVFELQNCSADRSGLTLLEMMVAITLLAAIMIGLLAMFNQTQKALHIANTQTDLFENGRGALQMITSDLAGMTEFKDTNVLNSFANAPLSPIGALPLPSTPYPVPVYFSEAFWLTRANDDWTGIGYFVAEDPALPASRLNAGVGSLYRYEITTNRQDDVPLFANDFTSNTNRYHRVSDGIVHFSMEAVYPTNTGPADLPAVGFVRMADFRFPIFVEEGLSTDPTIKELVAIPLPAFVDVELGVLEASALKQFKSLNTLDTNAAQRFLTNHVTKIHFFRERVPIRNFINPYRSNEVP
jgi:prepilin-type N-terminal cleavage/methylation domain-containing protein